MRTIEADIGAIVKAVGLKGEVKLLPGHDFWVGALDAGGLELVGDDGASRTVQVNSRRRKGNTFVLKISGIEDIDAANATVGSRLVVSLEDLDDTVRPDRLLPCQVIGLEVRLTDGTAVGRVADMLLGAAQDCFIVERDHETVLVPNVSDVVRRLDLDSGVIEIDPPDGLLDLRW